MRVSPAVFRELGSEIGGFPLGGSANLWMRRHRAHFGCMPLTCAQLWDSILIPTGALPKHLMWALLFLRTYDTEERLASLCGVKQEKTLRRWVWSVLDALSDIDYLGLIEFERRFVRAPGANRCLITVDGTDFKIREPIPFDRKWYSHKINGPALRYEIGISIATGWIVWVNGPFPAGDWPDLRIVRENLIHELLPWEYYIADGGYNDGQQFSITPSGRHEFVDRQRAQARARHETINGRFKFWNSMSGTWRHCRVKHGVAFRALANIIQLELETVSEAFQMEYNEAEL